MVRLPADCAPPRLLRSVLLQALLLTCAAVVAERPWARRPPQAEPAPPKPAPPPERQLRVVRAPPPPPPAPAPSAQPPPPQARPAPARPPPQQPAPQRPAVQARAATPPPLPGAARPAPVRIAADSTAVHGVRLRVLVPRSPAELASHLRNSGGCLVVSRLDGAGAEVLSVLGLVDLRAVELSEPPCGGVPRLLSDAALNLALGDPLGRARAAHPGERLALQVLLTPRLPDLAQAALRSRFGPISQEEIAQKAAESGYQLTCFAEPEGSVRCE